jgi:hypothetical protein
MIHVYVWDYRGSTEAWGHASMAVGPTYISWWPGGEGRRYKLSDHVPIYSVAHIVNQTFDDDKELEGDGGSPRQPDHTITLNGLEERRIGHWWSTYSKPGNTWTTLGKNCSTTVARALMVGGGDDYAEGFSGWWRSWNTVWTPNNVRSYAQAIKHGLRSVGSRHFAVSFVRRFTHSPLAMTSLTLSMDEKGLATALYDEHGADASRVEQVCRELDKHRHFHAADVFEAYVHLLMHRKGAPLEAVRRTPALKERLIKVLNEGWVTSSQEKCIAFLKRLH